MDTQGANLEVGGGEVDLQIFIQIFPTEEQEEFEWREENNMCSTGPDLLTVKPSPEEKILLVG